MLSTWRGFTVVAAMLALHTGLLMVTVVMQAEAQGLGEERSSTYGYDFYLGFMPNLGSFFDSDLSLVIGTPVERANFTVEVADGQFYKEETTTNEAPVTVKLGNDLHVSSSDYSNRNKGIHVYSSEDEPIYILGINSIGFVNYGVYLAYPCLKFDTEIYEYRIVSTQDNITENFRSSFLLIGCEDDTQITLTPTQSISLPKDTQAEDSTTTTIGAQGEHQFVLHQMHTLYVSSLSDLTGTRIVSNKPLTVISGHECANIPANVAGCEPFALQVPPTLTWGTNFLITPFTGRTGAQHFKAVTSTNETSLIVTCNMSSTLADGSTVAYTFITQNKCHLISSDPVLLVQMSIGGGIDSRGDPAITMISPIDQYIHDIEFITPSTSDFASNYISITVEGDNCTTNRIMLDGVAVSCDWQEIYDNSNSIIGCACSLPISSERNSVAKHVISHSDEDGLLSVLVYGFDTFPQRGYAYLAGQRLEVTQEGGKGFTAGISFADLTAFTNMNALDKVEDAASDPIPIPDPGLIFGDKFVKSAYVNENGVITFDEPWKYSYPDRFPTTNTWIASRYAVAPFWSDNDIRKAGEVLYATYNAAEGDANPEGNALLEEVNMYIQNNEDEEFEGSWLLVAHWKSVHQSPHGADNHTESQLDKTNNYQAIVVTNMTQSFAVFNYMCGEMQWSGLSNPAVVGYNANGNFYGNHPASGFGVIGDAVSCTFQVKKRRKRRSTHNARPWFFRAPANSALQSHRDNCSANITQDEGTFASLGIDFQDVISMLLPCPKTQEQAMFDRKYLKQTTYNCYVTSIPLSIYDSVTPTQQCCYDSGNGALDYTTDTGAGTMLLYHPIFDKDKYEHYEITFRETCCFPDTKNIGLEYYCGEYFKRRPRDDGERYENPALAFAATDPHYQQFNKQWFNFQGIGDFNVLNIYQDVNEEPIFSLQGRNFEYQIQSWLGASWHTKIAFGNPSKLAFNLDGSSGGFKVYQTLPQLPQADITGQLQNGQYWMIEQDGETAVLIRNGNQLIATFAKSGVSLIADIYDQFSNRPEINYINYCVQVPRSFANKTRGLFGILDGDGTLKHYGRGDTNPQLSGIRDGAELYDLLQSWKVENTESLFFNPNMGGKRQADDFSPIFFDNLNITDEQIGLCGGSELCLFDFAVTGEVEIAENILETEENATKTEETLSNFPPSISADAVLRVSAGERSVYTLTVTDPGDTFTLSVQGGLPSNSVLHKVRDGEYRFIWTLQDITTESLVFVATDSKGAASTFNPTVEVCACVNEGQCTLEGLLTSNETIVMNCKCTEAFSGDFCEEDRNGCSEIQCFEGVECMDVPAPGVGAVCGSCPNGYTGDANKCYDIDECALNATLCEQLCINTDGSYTCACNEGHQLIEGTNQCQDVDECEEGGANDCQQLCDNTEGSYVCSCTDGFTLADSSNCTADQPCMDGGGCSHICANVESEEKCFCPLGLELSTPGGTQCIDKDECLQSPCDKICTNTEGSFECSCESGYELKEDERTCEDIDECLEAALEAVDLCVDIPNTHCMNLDGSFECICDPGYSSMNGTCKRVIVEVPPPAVVFPDRGLENRLNFTSVTLTPERFTLDKQQLFRKVTASIVTALCSKITCSIVLDNGKLEEKIGLKVEPQNIAIPNSLISKFERQLTFAFYVQTEDGFLSKEQLESAVQGGEVQYRCAGFLLPSVALQMSFTNDSPRISGDTVDIDFTTSEPTTSLGCFIRNKTLQIVEDCSSNSVEFGGLAPGWYVFVAKGTTCPGETIALRRAFWIGETYCNVYLINNGITVDKDSVTVEFAGNQEFDGFEFKLDNNDFSHCTSPLKLFRRDLSSRRHKIVIRPKDCGAAGKVKQLRSTFTIN